MPRMPKAQARGLVMSSKAGSACSNSQAAMFCRAGVLERPSTVPSAHSVRPWLSSEPTSSSQARR